MSEPAKTRPCQRCGNMIPPERAELLPETRLCVECSKAVGSEFQLSVVSENLAKTGSLKKNCGSFAVKKTRRPLPPRG